MKSHLNSSQPSSIPATPANGELDFDQWAKLVRQQMMASLRKRQSEVE
ncbi:hypothetical protein [Leptolyngbya ohadii]|nr:hypothetical protein [Leptolyngbya ohadii]